MATKAAELWVEIGAKLDKFNAGMASVEKRMVKVGQKMAVVGRKMTRTITLPILALGVAATKMSVDFNKSMASVATLIPGNIKRINELKENVQGMAVATGKSTGDIARGLYEIVSAFGDSAATAKILDTNVRAAAAGMSTTLDSIKLTSAVTKAYGDVTARAIQKAADLAFMTVKLGQTTFPELAESIGDVTPLAKELKVSQEELFTVFATLTGVTGNANRVSTQFSGILRAMIKPTEDMKRGIAAVGKQIGLGSKATAKAIIDNLGLKKTLEALVATTDGTTRGIAKLFSRVEGMVGLLPLLSTQSETYNEKLKQITKSSGAADEAFKEISEGINKAGFSMARLKQEVVVLSQKFGDILMPIIKSLVDSHIKPAVEWFSNLSEGMKKTIIQIAGLVAVAGPLLLIFGKMIVLIRGIAKAILFLAASTMTLTKAFGILSLTGVGVLLVALAGLLVMYQKVKSAQKELIKAQERENDALKSQAKRWAAVALSIGMTGKEILAMTRKYNNNYSALFRAIKLGKEGKELQEAYTKTIRRLKGEIEKETGAQDALTEAQKKGEEQLKELIKQQQIAEEAAGRLGKKTEELGSKIVDMLLPPAKDVSKVLAWLRNEAESLNSALANLSEKGMLMFNNMTFALAGGIMNALGAFQRFGEGGANVMETLGGVIHGFVSEAINALKRFTAEIIVGSLKIVLAKKVEAIAGVIASVMKSIPFPLNLLLAGGAIAAVSALFSGLKPKKFEAGGFVPTETFAHLHPGERVLSAAEVRRGGGEGGGVVINVSPVINIAAMDSMGVRDFMRNRGLPQIIEAVKAGVMKPEFREALGVKT